MMATMQDSLTPKRDYLESRIRHHAGSAGLSIDALSWRRPPDQDVSELTITISGMQKHWIIPHTNDPLGFALLRATNRESDELAQTIVSDLPH
jgi:hypothetical protein